MMNYSFFRRNAEKVRAELRKRGIDVMILTHQQKYSYVSGNFHNDFNLGNCIFVWADQEPTLLVAIAEWRRLKYEGYIKKQLAQVEQMRRLENRALPADIDYRGIGGLRLEAVEKLTRLRPLNIGQASRISGVSPADVSVLLIWLSQHHASAQNAGEENK